LTYIGARYAVVGDPLDAVVEVDVHGGLVLETAENASSGKRKEARSGVAQGGGEEGVAEMRGQG
jgi:hypothetical protein